MKNGIPKFLVVMVLVGYVVWTMLEEDIKSTNTTSQTSVNQPSINQTSTQPMVNPWPFTDNSESDSVVTENLLATNIYVVFDGSGSMDVSACSGGQLKIDAAKKAVREFVESIPKNTNVGMLSFDLSGTKERVPLGAINYDQMSDVINKIRAGRDTPLSTAIDHAYIALTQQARKQLGYGDYHLLVVTDGGASNGFDPTQKLNQILVESPVVVHTIGFCIGKEHSLNQPGRTLYSTAQDYTSLREGLQSVLAEAPEFTISEFE